MKESVSRRNGAWSKLTSHHPSESGAVEFDQRIARLAGSGCDDDALERGHLRLRALAKQVQQARGHARTGPTACAAGRGKAGLEQRGVVHHPCGMLDVAAKPPQCGLVGTRDGRNRQAWC